MIIEPITAVQLALFALKVARDSIPALCAHKERCMELIDRCERLMVVVWAHCRSGLPSPLDRHLKDVESACEAVRDTAKNLSDRNVAWQFFNRREIDEIFRCAETRLADAFAIYNVGAQLTQARRNEELARELEKDKRELLAYVTKLSEERLRMVKEVQSRLPLSPIRDVFPITPVNSAPWRISERDIQPVNDTAPCAEGTMGQAKRGRLGGGIVVVKQIHGEVARILGGTKERRNIFEHKVEQWSKLSHPHVSQFLGACFELEQPLLVSVHYSNGDVRAFLRNNPGNILSILHQVATGMQYLHGRKIIHANLKPSNILVQEDRRVVVHDYELGRLHSNPTLPGPAPRHHVNVMRNYMSFEFLSGVVDYPTDVYSFAMCAWSLYTGCIPFQQVKSQEFLEHIRISRPAKPATIRQDLWVHIELWWSPKSSSRTTFEVIESLLQKVVEPETRPPPGRALRRVDVHLDTKYTGPPTPSGSPTSLKTPVSPFLSSSSRSAFSVDEEGRTPLSKEGEEAISRVRYALHQPFTFDDIVKEVLLCYGNWFKKSAVPTLRGPQLQFDYEDGAENSVVTLRTAVLQWTNEMPWLQGADVFDRRRAILFIAVICVMAESALRLKKIMPYRQLDNFVAQQLAQSRFRLSLEEDTKKMWSFHQNSLAFVSIDKDMKRLIERGCATLGVSQ